MKSETLLVKCLRSVGAKNHSRASYKIKEENLFRSPISLIFHVRVQRGKKPAKSFPFAPFMAMICIIIDPLRARDTFARALLIWTWKTDCSSIKPSRWVKVDVMCGNYDADNQHEPWRFSSTVKRTSRWRNFLAEQKAKWNGKSFGPINCIKDQKLMKQISEQVLSIVARTSLNG